MHLDVNRISFSSDYFMKPNVLFNYSGKFALVTNSPSDYFKGVGSMKMALIAAPSRT